MTRALVVDASVVVKWLVLESDSEHAIRLLNSSPQFCAPELVFAEAANALWAIHRRGKIAASDLVEAIAVLQNAPISIPRPMSKLMPAASQLAIDLDHPVYDCFYLALAIQTQYPVVTADQTFYRKASAHSYLSRFLVDLAQIAKDPG